MCIVRAWVTLSVMVFAAVGKTSFINYLGPVFILGLLLVAWPAQAPAQGTWKCTTADGGVAYVNNHVSDYAQCERLSVPGMTDQPAAKPAPAPEGSWQYQEARATEPAPAPSVASTKPAANTQVVRGSVYRVRRADGVSEYTNVRPRGKAGEVALLFHYMATCRACDVHSTVDWAAVPLVLDKFASQIDAAATEFDVDRSLLRALIHAESGFDPRALSHKGAQGLTQLMPATATSMGVADAFDPADNIRGGARYLAAQLQAFNGDVRLAAAAYNAGPGAVRKYGGVPPYAETQVYVDRVEQLAGRYRAAETPATAPALAGGAAVTAAAR